MIGQQVNATIRPGIVLATGESYYPTGDEWIVAFALAGFQWAIDAAEQREQLRTEAMKGHNED